MDVSKSKGSSEPAVTVIGKRFGLEFALAETDAVEKEFPTLDVNAAISEHP